MHIMAHAMLRAAAVLALAGGAQAQGSCAASTSCDACTSQPYCGWCQPGPIVYKNGVRVAPQPPPASCHQLLPAAPRQLCTRTGPARQLMLPAVRSSAQSVGSRCGDGRDKGDWSCPGSYTTDKCTVRSL
jgi:hypothetical protein